MPDIKFPEVKFPEFKLPEGLRDMSREDIQKAMSDVKMPDVKMPKRSDIVKNIENALPRREGPSPVPFAVLAMVGGLVVGWILATSSYAPRITAAMDGVRQKIDDWRSSADGLDDDLNGSPEAFRDAFRAPAKTDQFASKKSETSTGASVGSSDLPESIDDSVSAKRN